MDILEFISKTRLRTGIFAVLIIIFTISVMCLNRHIEEKYHHKITSICIENYQFVQIRNRSNVETSQMFDEFNKPIKCIKN